MCARNDGRAPGIQLGGALSFAGICAGLLACALAGLLAGPALGQADAEEPAVSDDASVPQISVQPLGSVYTDALGLLPPSITGLPAGLWGTSDLDTLAGLMREQPIEGLPAMLDFTEMLALAELAPPQGADPEGSELFFARIDLLLKRGALDPAQALMERAGSSNDEVFRRWFDVALLTEHEDRACNILNANPDLAPDLTARIFCLARGGDWRAAALSLDAAEALGEIDDAQGELIARFLDPELFEDAPPLPPGRDLTSVEFSMRVALAERPDTTNLPLRFVHADLSALSGWRSQIIAAERLMRALAIEPQQWLAIYTARTATLSGEMFERVAAVQALDAALLSGDVEEVSELLPAAWEATREAGLGTAFADVFAARLARTPFTDETGELARRIILLSPDYEQVASASVAQSADESFYFAIARGQTPTVPPPDGVAGQAVARAFANPMPGHGYQSEIDANRLGEALLRAALVLVTGSNGSNASSDADALSDALLLFRSVGLETIARRAALELLLL